jgi:hypothetical protein
MLLSQLSLQLLSPCLFLILGDGLELCDIGIG